MKKRKAWTKFRKINKFKRTPSLKIGLLNFLAVLKRVKRNAWQKLQKTEEWYLIKQPETGRRTFSNYVTFIPVEQMKVIAILFLVFIDIFLYLHY